jgi:hypothetical protein
MRCRAEVTTPNFRISEEAPPPPKPRLVRGDRTTGAGAIGIGEEGRCRAVSKANHKGRIDSNTCFRR